MNKMLSRLKWLLVFLKEVEDISPTGLAGPQYTEQYTRVPLRELPLSGDCSDSWDSSDGFQKPFGGWLERGKCGGELRQVEASQKPCGPDRVWARVWPSPA